MHIIGTRLRVKIELMQSDGQDSLPIMIYNCICSAKISGFPIVMWFKKLSPDSI